MILEFYEERKRVEKTNKMFAQISTSFNEFNDRRFDHWALQWDVLQDTMQQHLLDEIQISTLSTWKLKLNFNF